MPPCFPIYLYIISRANDTGQWQITTLANYKLILSGFLFGKKEKKTKKFLFWLIHSQSFFSLIYNSTIKALLKMLTV